MLLSQTSIKDMYDIDNIFTGDIRSNGAVLEFRTVASTGNNKWKKEGVVSDILIERCILTDDQLSKLDLHKDNLDKEIELLFEKSGDMDFVSDIMRHSTDTTHISVSLPYRVKAGIKSRDIRGMASTFYPAKVNINGEDVSRTFEVFDMFGSDIIPAISDALVGDFDFRRLNTPLSNVEDVLELRHNIRADEARIVGCAEGPAMVIDASEQN